MHDENIETMGWNYYYVVVWTGFPTFIWRLRRDNSTSGRDIDNQNGYMGS